MFSDRFVVGNGRFCNLLTTEKRCYKRRKDLICNQTCNGKRLLSATSLLGPGIKHGPLRGYNVKKSIKAL